MWQWRGGGSLDIIDDLYQPASFPDRSPTVPSGGHGHHRPWPISHRALDDGSGHHGHQPDDVPPADHRGADAFLDDQRGTETANHFHVNDHRRHNDSSLHDFDHRYHLYDNNQHHHDDDYDDNLHDDDHDLHDDDHDHHHNDPLRADLPGVDG